MYAVNNDYKADATTEAHMDFGLTEEQSILLDSVDKFCRREIDPVVDEGDRNKILHEPTVLKGWLKKLAPFGFISGPIPEELGGMGLDYLTVGLAHQKLGEYWSSLQGCCVITLAGARLISEITNEKIKQKYVPGICSGDLIPCAAITEPNVGSNPLFVEASLKKTSGGYLLNGTKTWISLGSVSDLAIVIASVDRSLGPKGLAAVLVDRRVSPYESRELDKLGWKAFPTSELVFDDIFVPDDYVIVPPGAGLTATLRTFELARSLLAANSVGISHAALSLAVSYAKERKQFGKSIGSFQLIQSMIADMRVRTDAAAFLTNRALWLMDQGKRCDVESSIAKYFATEASVQTASDCIQILGAYGYSPEYRAERFFRDARMTTIPDGTSQIQKLIVARDLLGLDAFV